jgi:hypothetical protein
MTRSDIPSCALLLALTAASIGIGTAKAQSTQPADVPAAASPAKQVPADAAAAPAVKPAPAVKQPVPPKKSAASGSPPVRYRPNRLPRRAQLNYELIWGVDNFSVRWAESGEMIRFSYHVLDADKATTLNDVAQEPALNDPKAGVSLVVPTLEKVGKLRQSAKPEAGKSYWMAFSNKGRLVKRGDHVNVVIGQFHADGLVVE